MLYIVFGLFGLLSCQQQPKIIYKINSLKEQELRVYYDVKNYPLLPKDSFGNYVVKFDTASILYTSTKFNEIKNHRNVFCFENKIIKCYNEDYELEADGFVINVYSNFPSDTTKKSDYINSYDNIFIEKLKRN